MPSANYRDMMKIKLLSSSDEEEIHIMSPTDAMNVLQGSMISQEGSYDVLNTAFYIDSECDLDFDSDDEQDFDSDDELNTAFYVDPSDPNDSNKLLIQQVLALKRANTGKYRRRAQRNNILRMLQVVIENLDNN